MSRFSPRQAIALVPVRWALEDELRLGLFERTQDKFAGSEFRQPQAGLEGGHQGWCLQSAPWPCDFGGASAVKI